MDIYDYTPCRVTECFLDENGEIELYNEEGMTIRFRGVGRTIWYMLDGKHTIRSIVDTLCSQFSTNDKEKMLHELLAILKELKKKNLIVSNWDPLYKLQLSQELNI